MTPLVNIPGIKRVSMGWWLLPLTVNLSTSSAIFWKYKGGFHDKEILDEVILE